MTITETDAPAATGMRFITDWQALDPAEGDAIREFWKREGALNDEAMMTQRLPQVVLHARDGDAVAGICTAVPTTPPAFGQPVYYYRSFVGKDWRTTILVEQLFERAKHVLEDFAQAHDFPCIGIMAELEGARFKEKGRQPVWSRNGLIYVGRSGRGLETRVCYFKGAKLKPIK